jgi:radical SAM family RiPP maturation amino acid epimerase
MDTVIQMPPSIDDGVVESGMPVSPATVHYRQIFARRSPAELHTLAHIKRFMERLVGDQSFRAALAENLDNPRIVTDRYGIDVDPAQMLPLWKSAYLHHRTTPENSRWPLSALWDEYMGEMIRHRDMLRDEGDAAAAHPRFHAWRERQIQRCNSELGGSAASVTHPIIAFELSEGCTVGCWFCGIAADRFKGHFAYTDDNAVLWRGAVTHARELFGPAVRTGFCYWATDPCDNPDYDSFLFDYYRITGALPQTTTAAPLKNQALTRRIMALFDRHRTVTNRFSILTTRQLDQIHAAFTPEELMGVEMVMQQKEALTAKAKAGRAEVRREKLREAGKSDKISLVEHDHTTIACVSGFLVNMLRGRIQLVTPVPGSKRWPLGYRILGERFFKTADEFRAGLESLIDAHMSIGMPSDRPLRFRADLKYSAGDKSFTLQSRGAEHTINDAAGAVSIGELIARGAHTASQLITQAATAGADILLVADLIDQLFDAGLLEEDFDDTFAERQNEGMIMRAAALQRAMAGPAPHAGPA